MGMDSHHMLDCDVHDVTYGGNPYPFSNTIVIFCGGNTKTNAQALNYNPCQSAQAQVPRVVNSQFCGVLKFLFWSSFQLHSSTITTLHIRRECTWLSAKLQQPHCQPQTCISFQGLNQTFRSKLSWAIFVSYSKEGRSRTSPERVLF